nr:MAG TPA: hypothetical protein [Bacteriophage sp.]
MSIDTKYSTHTLRVGEYSNFYNVNSNICNLVYGII